MQLTPMIESFVMHFGEMGSRWGFNRTVGQIVALLVVSEEPITANDIADALRISRGNVSMGLKELQAWRLVQLQHKPGDRKEYFQANGSIWDMANRVFEERRKREMDPTLSLLRDILLDEPANQQEVHAQQKFQEVHDLLEGITKWSSELQRLSPEKLNALMKLGSGVGKVLDIKDKLLAKSKS
ncbi:MAG: GbsR/MarR family transcriptional regulator [Paraglaciecola sp.]|uniref:GbsR/MarR family transcriptional regulator n=1 Tax=Pseudomonadati TaxID=3379134 RepID=UPI00273F7F60|nr:GbsR/MarR family transcriptional regulator [Paraglaciecola sp.]MDP5031691.1 GbsR/MarR family transcriptional regulator [Paraglaciecola sp.]MDP5041622.1 GbsR/MarR family transcriptional regulator [Paraglaciecola sp.]MDP5131867.1 GbsR/MarR family transcriptional regulator [Paraglaciecola sp.]